MRKSKGQTKPTKTCAFTAGSRPQHGSAACLVASKVLFVCCYKQCMRASRRQQANSLCKGAIPPPYNPSTPCVARCCHVHAAAQHVVPYKRIELIYRGGMVAIVLTGSAYRPGVLPGLELRAAAVLVMVCGQSAFGGTI